MTLRLPAVLPALLALLALLPGNARGDGGTLRIADLPVGEYRVTVFTAPSPLRPDSIDVSFLITEADRRGNWLFVAEGVEVWVEVEPVGGGTAPVRYPATREQADEPRFYAAKFSLESPGDWVIRFHVRGPGGEGEGDFQVKVTPAGVLDHPLVLLGAALLPLLLVGLWMRAGARRSNSE